MTKQTVPDLKEIFRQAAEVAQQVPENMQEAAFNRALDLLVGEESGTTQKVRNKPLVGAAIPEVEANEGPPVQTLLTNIDSTRHPGVRAAAKVLDRSLMVLQIALREHSVDGLTPVEIAKILTEKFRLGTSRQAVGMALKDASDLVDRVAEGRGYRYRIMGPGEEYLAHLNEETSNTPAAPRARPRRRASKKSKEAKPDAGSGDAGERSGPRKKASKGPRKSKKLGPKAAVVGLIESGYFDEARTGPEVQKYLEKKRGFDLGIDQIRLAMLRLVRDEVLERDENDERQYEYKRA